MPKMFDVNPQLLKINASESAANTFTEEEKVLPVVTITEGKTLVVELLKLFVYNSSGALVDGDILDFHLSTISYSSIQTLDKAGIIFRDTIQSVLTTSGANVYKSMHEYDFTDGNGNGLLIASHSLFVGVKGTSQVSALSCQIAILYRLKEVKPEEYIGIVQSQS